MSSPTTTDMSSPTPSEPGLQWDARLWGALVVLCGVLFLDGLDVSMVGVALPSIRADLGLSTSSLQWVVSGYVLGYGGLLLLGGRFADLLGRRRVLLGALAVFTVASVLGGLVSDGTLLVVTRFLKGAAAAFTAAAMLLLVRTVVEAPETGWGAPETLGGLLLSALLVAAFVAIELRSAHPLVRLGILRSGRLVRANLGMMTVFGAYVSFQFVGTLYLQSLLGWSALETALAFLPGGLLVAFGAPRIGPLVDRFGTERIILVGAVAFAVGYALFLRIGESFSYAAIFLPTILLIGFGFALCYPTFNIQATAGVANHEQGLASGLVNTSFQVGGAVGLAIVTAAVSANSGPGADAASMLDGFRPAIAVVTGIAVIGLAIALAGM